MHPAGCMPWTFGCLWGLLCDSDGGCRDNKSLCINAKKKIAKPLAPQKHSKNRQLYHLTDTDSYINNIWRINISLSASSKCFEDGKFTYSVEVKAIKAMKQWMNKKNNIEFCFCIVWRIMHFLDAVICLCLWPQQISLS